MQSYAEKGQQSNVFTQFSAWKAQRSANRTNSDINRIVHLRNDKTSADEALLWIYLVLSVAGCFTAYCGFLYYKDVFSKAFSENMTLIFAVALAIVVGVCKILLCHQGLRSVFFGWMFKDFWSLGYWCFVIVLAIGSYFWSIDISTVGMRLLTADLADSRHTTLPIEQRLAAATSGIDAQIADAQTNQKNALGIKWKNTTTWQAQKLATRNASTIENLQSQRARMIDEVSNEHTKEAKKFEIKVGTWAYWVNKFGGWMELVEGLCLLCIAFFQRRLYSLNKHMIQNAPSPSPAPTGYHPDTRRSGSPVNGAGASMPTESSYFNSAAPSVRMGFALSEQKAVRASSTDSDFINLRMKRLKGWDDNFNDPKNKPETVATNMTMLLNEIGKKMQEHDFNPDPATMQSLIEYVTETGLPAMEKAGFIYKYKQGFLDLAARYAGAAAA